MMILEQTAERPAELTLQRIDVAQTNNPLAAQLLQLDGAYPREIRFSELRTYDSTTLHAALAGMGIYVRAS